MGGCVAQVRGAEFKTDECDVMYPDGSRDQRIADHALRDVAAHYGFRNVGEFLGAQTGDVDPIADQRTG